MGYFFGYSVLLHKVGNKNYGGLVILHLVDW